MPDAGPYTITEPGTYRCVCTGEGGTIVSAPFMVAPAIDCAGVEPPTCQITSQPSPASGNIGDPINLGGTATGTIQWQTSGSAFGPWTNTTAPTAITTSNAGRYYRFCCADEPTVCSTVVQITELTTGNLTNRTTVLANEGTNTEEFCAGCVADWEVRILDPRDQFNTPNNDPGVPEPTDDAWQTVSEVAGQECITLAVNELWLDGQNPDTHGAPAEQFYLYIAAVCQGTGQRQEATLTIEV